MITKAILDQVFDFILWLGSQIPVIQASNASHIITSIHSGLAVLLDYGLKLLPARCWDTFVVTVIAVKTLQFVYVIIEWVVKKIPGMS